MPDSDHSRFTLADFVAVVRHYRVLIIPFVVLVPITAFLYATQQPAVYQANAEVLLEQQDLGAAITGIPTATSDSDPERYARTQAALAHVESVAQRAITIAGANLTPDELLRNSDVSPRVDSDLLRFTVDDPKAGRAARLASAYASAFTSYKLDRDTKALREARAELEGRLVDLRGQGATTTELYADLVRKVQDLRTLELLQARASVVRPATSAEQVAPRPIRSAALGVALGLLVGLGVAFLVNALDRRIRTTEEIETGLGLPLLARIPRFSSKASRQQLVMLGAPSDFAAESIRRLRTNLELAATTSTAKTIMVTSAAPQEGKSTTLANLAIALARSGHRVALVDLDLRQPAIAHLLGVDGTPGVTEVVDASLDLRLALRNVRLPERNTTRIARGSMPSPGVLDLLPAGSLPPDPGEVVASQSLALLLAHLREGYDFVLIDAPPMLAVGDSMTLSTQVDAMFVVIRTAITNRPMLRDLSRALQVCPANAIGFVVTDVDVGEMYGTLHYGYADSKRTQSEPVPLRNVRARQTP